jgi:outer membrane protein assembly factor BamB
MWRRMKDWAARLRAKRAQAMLTLWLAALAAAGVLWAKPPGGGGGGGTDATRPPYELPKDNPAPWPKNNHDLRNSGQSPYVGPLLAPTQLWTTAFGHRSVVVDASGNIYVPLACFDTSGALLWKAGVTKDGSTADFFEPGYDFNQQLGSDGSVTLGLNGTVYTTGYASSSTGHVSAVNPRDPSDPTGETLLPRNARGYLPQSAVLWTFFQEGVKFESRLPVFAPAEVVGEWGDTVYAVSIRGGLYALNAATGVPRWSLELGTVFDFVGSPGNGNELAIDTDGTIYAAGDGKLFAIDDNGASGSVRWTVDLRGRPTNPVVSIDHTIYLTTTVDSSLYAVNPNGTVKWKVKVTQAGVSPGGDPLLRKIGGVALDEFYDANPPNALSTTIYVGVRRGVQAFRADGSLKWKFEDATSGANVLNAPAIGADGIVYGFNGRLFAVTDQNVPLWTVDVGGSAATPAIGADGRLFVNKGATGDEGIAAFR